MTSAPIRIIGEVRARLGESPLWCAQTESLYWVDIDAQLLYRTDPDTDEHHAQPLPGRPGSVMLTPEPGVLVVAIEDSLMRFDWATGSLSRLIMMDPVPMDARLNDGRADARGRVWVGSMDESDDDPPVGGHLYRVDNNGGCHAVLDSVGTSNGLAFSPDGATMYWADSARATVWRFDFDSESGTISERRVFLDFTDLPGLPDGACVDAEGCYWVACVYGFAVLRATPDGRVDRVIDLPVEKPSMPAFGGRNLDRLFITSISSGGRRPSADLDDNAGALLEVDPGVRGLPEPPARLVI